MSVSINARMIGFWERIITGKKEKISRTLYDMLYRLDAGDVYHSKWLIHVKNVLVSCGHMNLWVDQFLARNFCLSKKVKQCCHDSFIEKWEREVFNSPKCLNYRMYKSKFGFEKYLTILPYDLMYILCKFRCCSHRLPIESGRFFSIDRSDRICDLCNLDELGDEFHICKIVIFQ